MSGPIIDMTPNGEFPQPAGTPISVQILRIAILVGVLAGALALAAFAIWVTLLLIPVVFAAGLIGWLAWRWRMWQMRARYSAATANVSARRSASANNV